MMSLNYISELNELENGRNKLEKYTKFILKQLERYEIVEAPRRNERDDNDSSPIGLSGIIEKLKYFNKFIVSECGINISDLSAFENDLVETSERIQFTKESSQFEAKELQNEIDKSFENLELLIEEIDGISSDRRYTNEYSKQRAHSKASLDSNMPQDVKNFANFVRLGGHENGWGTSDHQLFLKLRKKLHNIDKLAETINDLMPDLSVEDVKNHELWYIKYVKLKEKHDFAIREWRESKDNSLKPIENRVELEEQINESIRKPKIDQKKVKLSIEKWKEKRQIKMENNEYTSMIKSTSAIIEPRKNESEKIMIQHWRAKKEIKEQERMSNEFLKAKFEKHIKSLVANKMIKLYQLQDLKYSTRKLKAKSERIKSGPVTLFKQNEHSKRDPQRIFKPTETWMNRFQLNINTNSPSDFKTVGDLAQIPKLQTPEWRRASMSRN